MFEFVILAILVAVSALPVTSPVTLPVKSPVNVPVIAPFPVIVGAVSVLFVNVSVVSLPTRVSVDVGSVSVPVLEIVDIVGVATNSNLTF